MLALIVDDSRSSVAQLRRWIEDVRSIDVVACLDPDDALALAVKTRSTLTPAKSPIDDWKCKGIRD